MKAFWNAFRRDRKNLKRSHLKLSNLWTFPIGNPSNLNKIVGNGYRKSLQKIIRGVIYEGPAAVARIKKIRFFIEFLCEAKKLLGKVKATNIHFLLLDWRTAQWILMRIYVNIMLEKYAGVAFINFQSGDPFSLAHWLSKIILLSLYIQLSLPFRA